MTRITTAVTTVDAWIISGRSKAGRKVIYDRRISMDVRSAEAVNTKPGDYTDMIKNMIKKKNVMKINESWVELLADSHANIQIKKGILNRQFRSIQTEGHFGDIKENDGFRRFNYRSEEKVYREFMLYTFSQNINKCHQFLEGKIVKYEGNRSRAWRSRKTLQKPQDLSFVRFKT